MAEVPGLSGQIMHTSTVEKMLQPAELKGELTGQQAAQATAEAAEVKRRTVQEAEEAQGGRVEEDRTRNKEGRQGRGRKKRGGEEDPEQEAKSGHIDIVV